MNTVKIRNLEIGKGMPKICVPIVGRTKQEILESAKEAIVEHPDDGGMESRLVYRSVPMGMCGIYAAGYA